MRQVETSRTLVFDAPRARAFFEAVVADNLDLGRPDQVEWRSSPAVRPAAAVHAKPLRRSRPRSSPAVWT